jgi:hypothetical protein
LLAFSYLADEMRLAKGRGIAGLVGLYVAWLVAAGMLVSAAVGRHPYSFYTLLRWICCPVFAYSAFAAHERNRMPWIWIFGTLALLYNPLFRFSRREGLGRCMGACIAFVRVPVIAQYG